MTAAPNFTARKEINVKYAQSWNFFFPLFVSNLNLEGEERTPECAVDKY